MKPLLRLIILPVILLCACHPQVITQRAAIPAQTQTVDAAGLLRQVQAAYASLQSYAATGEVRSVVTMDSASTTGLAGGTQEIRSTFTIKLARPQMYKVLWEQNMAFFSNKGALWSDGESRFITLAGQTSQPRDTETALAMATGVSGGAANTIPSIFFNLSANTLTSIANVAALSGEDAVDGEECYVVKAHLGRSERTIWISKASKLIRQERSDVAGSAAPPELTDAEASKVLESMGRKVTEESIRTLRDQMASTEKLMKAVQSSYSIETHREIKTNDPMPPSDFRQPPAVSDPPAKPPLWQ